MKGGFGQLPETAHRPCNGVATPRLNSTVTNFSPSHPGSSKQVRTQLVGLAAAAADTGGNTWSQLEYQN
jgi:hypothetical protein